MLERWVLAILPSLLIVASRPFAWPMLLVLVVAPMLLFAAGTSLLRNHSSVSWILTVFAMLVTAVVFGKGGWWSIDDDDNYSALAPILVMSIIPWWAVRPRSLPRVFLPPSLLILAFGLLALALWRGEELPRGAQVIVLVLIQALALAAILLFLDWWPDSPRRCRGTTVLAFLNAATSFFVGIREMSDRAVFRDRGTQTNIILAVLFGVVVPAVLLWRVAEYRARGKANTDLTPS